MFAIRLEIPFEVCMKERIINDYEIHRFVYRLFMESPNSKNRDFLYRADLKREKLILTVHSRRVPAFFDCRGDIEVKEINDTFLDYPMYSFSLRFAPIKQTLQRKEIALLREEDAILWLKKREAELGVEFLDGTLFRSKKGAIFIKNVPLNYSDISGVLRVIDKERFITSFKKGIGRHKAFGFGMLQLIPIK